MNGLKITGNDMNRCSHCNNWQKVGKRSGICSYWTILIPQIKTLTGQQIRHAKAITYKSDSCDKFEVRQQLNLTIK